MADRWNASPSSPCTARTCSRARSCSSSAELGQEDVARAVAAAAYERGAKFVDVIYFDPYLKRARIEHADPTRSASCPTGTASACSSTPSGRARASRLRAHRAEPARRPRPDARRQGQLPAREGADEDRQRPHDELVHRPGTASGVGEARLPGSRAGGGVRAALAASSSTCSASTSRTRTRPGTSAWTF